MTIPHPFGYGWCFGYVAVLDVFTLLLVLVLVCLNKFGNTAPAEDEALGNVAESDDVVTSDSSNDQSNYSDGPMGEIHQEIIEELDSDEEGTVRRDSVQIDLIHGKAGDLASTFKSQEDLKVFSYKENLAGNLEVPNKLRRSRKASYEEEEKPTV
jgi:hypothetical protein